MPMAILLLLLLVVMALLLLFGSPWLVGWFPTNQPSADTAETAALQEAIL